MLRCRSVEPTNHRATTTDTSCRPRRRRPARRFCRHGSPMLAYQHWYRAGLDHDAAARHTSGRRSRSPSWSGSLVVGWVARETDSDPQQNPATHPTAPARPGPFPLVSGPPEALF
jgi:hypothetical protein